MVDQICDADITKELKHWTLDAIKSDLRLFKLPEQGRKSELIKRLAKKYGGDNSTSFRHNQYAKWKVQHLRNEIEQHQAEKKVGLTHKKSLVDFLSESSSQDKESPTPAPKAATPPKRVRQQDKPLKKYKQEEPLPSASPLPSNTPNLQRTQPQQTSPHLTLSPNSILSFLPKPDLLTNNNNNGASGWDEPELMNVLPPEDDTISAPASPTRLLDAPMVRYAVSLPNSPNRDSSGPEVAPSYKSILKKPDPTQTPPPSPSKVKFHQVHVVELERQANGGGGVPNKGGYALGLGWNKCNSFNRTVSDFEQFDKSPHRGRVHEKERIKLLGLDKDLDAIKKLDFTKNPTSSPQPKRAASITRHVTGVIPKKTIEIKGKEKETKGKEKGKETKEKETKGKGKEKEKETKGKEIKPRLQKNKTEVFSLDFDHLAQLEKDKKELNKIRQSRKKVGCSCHRSTPSKGQKNPDKPCCTSNKCPCFKNEIECNEGSCACMEEVNYCKNPRRFVFDEDRVNEYRRKRIQELNSSDE